jgi:hypothetical protein
MNQDFDVNLEYSVYADIEGEALLKAFQETDETKALEYFKDSLVAREIKQKAMPPAVVIADLLKTRDEGTATYANLQMAILIKKTGYQSEAAKNDEVISSAFKHVDDYIKKEAVSSLEATAGKTLEVAQRFYIYGAIQCLLLDRFLPQWKKGFFENDRTLDEVAAGSLNLSEGDKQRIAERLKTDFSFNEIRARHRQVIQNRDNAIQLVMNRKGKKYLIDVKHAQQGFNIEPRELVLCRQEQIYPHGLRGFVFGSLKLISQDTPMRFITAQYVLEWIDTEAKEGEKGYELKYETKDGDLYKNVTLTAKGFTLTAKAINIVEEVDLVKIQIRD